MLELKICARIISNYSNMFCFPCAKFKLPSLSPLNPISGVKSLFSKSPIKPSVPVPPVNTEGLFTVLNFFHIDFVFISVVGY